MNIRRTEFASYTYIACFWEMILVCCWLWKICDKNNKKLIRRWDSKRELSLRRHRTHTTKYNRLVHKFRHRMHRLCVGTYVQTKFSEITQCNGHCVIQGNSRSPIFGTNRKLIYDFLLVINTNLPPISHRFQVMADYSSNFR